MISYIDKFCSTNAQIVQKPVDELESWLQFFKFSFPPLNCCEIVLKDAPVKLYFDFETYSTESFEINDVVQVIKAHCDIEEEPSGISCSSGETKDGFKISYHIVFPLKTSTSSIKKLIPYLNEKINTQLSIAGSPLDSRVYASQNQRFRLPFCTKPPEFDPTQRKKIPCKGSLRDNFITYLDGTEREWMNEVVTPVTVFSKMTLRAPPQPNPHLLWFKYILEEPAFKPKLKEKSQEYESWILVGGSIWKEAEISNQHDFGERLFLAFSAFSEKFNEEDSKRKYRTAFTTVQVSCFPAIKAFITKTNKEVAARFNPTYTDGVMVNTASLTLPNITIADLSSIEEFHLPTLLDFLPFSSFEFRILQQLIKSPKILSYWAPQIKKIDDLRTLFTLSRSGPDSKQKQEVIEVEASLSSLYQKYGEVDYIPYCLKEKKKAALQFLSILASFFQIEEDLSLFEDWITEKDDDAQLQLAWNQYSLSARSLDSLVYDQIEESINSFFVFRQHEMETKKSYMEIVLGLFNHVKNGLFYWKSRIPYLPFFDLLVKEFTEEVPFSFFFPHYISLLAVEKEFNFLARTHSYLHAASLVYEFYPHWIKGLNQLMVYDDLSGKWSSDDSIIHRTISRFSPFLQLGKDNLGDSFANRKNLAKEIECLQEVTERCNTFRDLGRSGCGKLLFPNGYYDGHESTFYPNHFLTTPNRHVFTSPTLLFFASVPDPYIPSTQNAIKDSIAQTFFFNMFSPGMSEYLIETYATALFGEKRKQVIVNLGETGSGKSSFKRFLEDSCGELMGTGLLDQFKYNANDSRDAGIQYSIAWHNWYKRILGFSEGGSKVMNSEMFKLFASGGTDVVTSRAQHEKDRTCDIHFRMFIFVNHMFAFSNNDNAIKERFDIVNWPFIYSDVIKDPTIEKQANESVNDWPNFPLYRQNFISLFIDSMDKYRERDCKYLPRPPELCVDNPYSIGRKVLPKDYFEMLMQYLVFHGQPNKYVTLQQLYDIFEQVEPNSESHGCKKIMNVIDSLKLPSRTISSQQKKVQKRNTTVYMGISLRETLINTPEEEMYLTDLEQWRDYMLQEKGVLSDAFIQGLREALSAKRHHKRNSDGELILTDYQKELLATYKLN